MSYTDPLILTPRSEGPSGHHKDLQDWLKNLPSNYTAMLSMYISPRPVLSTCTIFYLAIMGWFLTLTSKMTGYKIPGKFLPSQSVYILYWHPHPITLLFLLTLLHSGVGLAPGGKIEFDREDVAHYIEDMEILADAMANEKNWNRPQVRVIITLTIPLTVQSPFHSTPY